MKEPVTRAELRSGKLQKVAADLFLKRGYDGVSIDQIVSIAGGSKSTVYSEFGGKCGLFISSIEKLCRESNDPLAAIDYTGLDLEQSLKKLAFHILKLVTARRTVSLYRLAIAEAVECPEVGEAWYTHGPARTAEYIEQLLRNHPRELTRTRVPVSTIAIMLRDALIADILYRLFAGTPQMLRDTDLKRRANQAVETILIHARTKKSSSV